MPLYEYRCRDCSHRFEILQRMGDGALGLACPHCSGNLLDKQFSTFAAASGGHASADGAMCEGVACGTGPCGAEACGCGPFGSDFEN
jgi:putative FmdB family regulatory protein